MSAKLLKTLNCIPKMFLNFIKDIMKWPKKEVKDFYIFSNL